MTPLQSLATAWRRRALPISIASLRGVTCVSYSQFGEDALVAAILGHPLSPGFYVDVGCFHPIKWSNTYAFYLQGWRGICIDPNQAFSASWRKWRPRDEFLNIGISAADSRVTYLRNARLPQENHLLMASNAVSDHAGEAVSIQVRRLDSVLDERLPATARIDVMSVDCEGHDLVVLRSNDFSRHRPRVLVAEDKAPTRLGESDMCAFIENQGYRLAGSCGPSRVFVDRAWTRSRNAR
jgi:FkbM family methyltransferase